MQGQHSHMNHSFNHICTLLVLLLLGSITHGIHAQVVYPVNDDPSDYDYLRATAQETAPGEEWVVTFSFDTEVDYTAFQMDLTFPDALAVYTKCDIFMAEGRGSDTHVFTTSILRGGIRRVVSYASDAAPYATREGDLFYIVMTATSPIPQGTYTITASNIRFSSVKGKETKADDLAITVNVTEDTIVPLSAERTMPLYWNLNGTRSTCHPGIVITNGTKRLLPAVQK